jgi:hypothetical protein
MNISKLDEKNYADIASKRQLLVRLNTYLNAEKPKQGWFGVKKTPFQVELEGAIKVISASYVSLDKARETYTMLFLESPHSPIWVEM